MNELFAYGTLLPGDVRWHVLEPFVVDEGRPDQAHGRLFDTGEGYPAAVFGSGEPGQDLAPDPVIEGRVFELVLDRLDDALERLDEVEGAVAGDYRRVEIVTRSGRVAWAYAYGGGLQLAPIVDGSWVAHRSRP